MKLQYLSKLVCWKNEASIRFQFYTTKAKYVLTLPTNGEIDADKVNEELKTQMSYNRVDYHQDWPMKLR